MTKNPTIIMVAPNGARKTHKDHPALPVSIAETVHEAAACHAAGATILHAHVRNKDEQHVIDASLYAELIGELKTKVPQMLVQITTEAVGLFTPEQQADCVRQVMPELASVALKEMTANFTRLEFAKDFYHWSTESNVHIQHIVYSADELTQFLDMRSTGIIPPSHRCVLFVLGRYAANFQSSPQDLQLFLQQDLNGLDWFTCAFGQQEQACIFAGIKQGGHARIGFENNLYLQDGRLSNSNSELVSQLSKLLLKHDQPIANSQQTRRILGLL